jgi:tRNA(fMet)-specific endonuclease VapC
MLVLDTDLLTLIQRKEGEAFQRLDARLADAAPVHQICLNVVSIEEQMRGWLAFIARAQNIEKQVEAYQRFRDMILFFQGWQILEFDDSAALQFQELRKARVRIGTMDLKIAAIALANDAILVSRNLKDFQNVPDLQVEDWTTAAE